ncbi:CoA-transferase family III [Roseovarius marisflavi]|uniref:CoA-transferase family III n=1 Tax=Roseovarius marisflavi TaxID=1054996 RepID=A0A1M6XD92_9RHOB|nr:CoA transferase [Roseovarius marisflavi]SHL03829.1 CoA-transferase family III [Roseovarius marisflavi]
MIATGPLSGLRVLDLTHVLAGPYATGQLALMGAEVIRVERPDSDDFVRTHGGTPDMRAKGLGASFLSQNSGKKSVVLDLKSDTGRATFLDLAATADIVTENFRPGVTERLGVDYDSLRAPALPFRAPWAPRTLAPAPTCGRDTSEILATLTPQEAPR